MKVKLSEVTRNPYNTREDYGDLNGLVESIRKFGLTQPLPVRKRNGKYELAFGSRRYEALKTAGVKDVEIDVRKMSNEDMAMLGICENVHRKDLNGVELARAYKRGLQATNLQESEFAKTIGEDQRKVSDYLRILDLPKNILNRPDKYGKMQLIALGKLNEKSRSIRVMLENVIGQRQVGTQFLGQIVSSCESVFASNLPSRKRNELCAEVIWHDYSDLPPENYKDIRTFSDALLGSAIAKHQERLGRKAKSKVVRKKIKSVKDIVHVDQKLDDTTACIRNAGAAVQKALRNEYYRRASKRSQRKFRTSVNHLTSGLEEVLGNE